MRTEPSADGMPNREPNVALVRIGPQTANLWRPIAAALVLATLVGLVAAATQLLGRGASGGSLFAMAGLLLSAAILFGCCQSAYWAATVVRTCYELDGIELRELHRGHVVSRWRLDAVDRCSLEGLYGWRDLLTASSASNFPRLVVMSQGEVTRCAPVLLWGRASVTSAQTFLKAQAKGL